MKSLQTALDDITTHSTDDITTGSTDDITIDSTDDITVPRLHGFSQQGETVFDL